MAIVTSKIPPGPANPFDGSEELLSWLEHNRECFGDIYSARIYGRHACVISGPGFIERVLRGNWKNYRKGHSIKRVELLLGRGLISSEGQHWRRQRRLIQPAFHARVITRLTRTIVDINMALRDRWEAAARSGTPVNVTHDISVMILELVLTIIFGEDYPRAAPEFTVLTDQSARDLQFAETFKPLRGVVSRLAAKRRAASDRAPDFLGMLMAARDSDSGDVMSDAQLVTEILTLVVAGHETTALTLNWAWYLLAQSPAVEEKLTKELNGVSDALQPDPAWLSRLPYCKHIIDESLRLYPPVWLLTRKALQDDQLGGYLVPAKTEIYISPYIVQRHPGFWKEPNRFDPDRFNPDVSDDREALAMHPFAAGPRNCIGEGLARLEMQLHLAIIAKSLRFRAPPSEPPELELGVNLRGKHDFIMVPELKAPLPS